MTSFKTINQRIENRILENKSSVKTYSTMEAAEKSGKKMVDSFTKYNENPIISESWNPIDYFVITTKAGRFTPVFNMSLWSHKTGMGTYLGFFSSKGFFSI